MPPREQIMKHNWTGFAILPGRQLFTPPIKSYPRIHKGKGKEAHFMTLLPTGRKPKRQPSNYLTYPYFFTTPWRICLVCNGLTELHSMRMAVLDMPRPSNTVKLLGSCSLDYKEIGYHKRKKKHIN